MTRRANAARSACWIRPQIHAGIRAIAAGGTTVPLVEQNVGEALRAVDVAYVLIGDPLVQEAFLGIGAA